MRTVMEMKLGCERTRDGLATTCRCAWKLRKERTTSDRRRLKQKNEQEKKERRRKGPPLRSTRQGLPAEEEEQVAGAQKTRISVERMGGG
jgi:hypothetical protein